MVQTTSCSHIFFSFSFSFFIHIPSFPPLTPRELAILYCGVCVAEAKRTGATCKGEIGLTDLF